MLNKIQENTNVLMEGNVNTFKKYTKNIRTGRASPSLFYNISIEYYGNITPLRELANIVSENNNMIVITVFDDQLKPAIEKAIIASNLGLNPFSINSIIRVPIPPLNKERRHHLIKIISSEAEKSKISLRNIRRNANNKIKKLLKNNTISKDEDYYAQHEIQKITDKWITIIDDIVEKKSLELIKV